jgi:hypothetical protein
VHDQRRRPGLTEGQRLQKRSVELQRQACRARQRALQARQDGLAVRAHSDEVLASIRTRGLLDQTRPQRAPWLLPLLAVEE